MKRLKRYDFVSKTRIDNLYVVCKANKWGVFNLTLNKEIIGLQYTDVKVFSSNCFAVKRDNYWQLLNSNNKLITRRRFNEISLFETDEYLLITNPHSSQVISLDTYAVSKCYDEIVSYDNYLHVRKGDFWGVLDKNMIEVIPVKYEFLLRSSDTVYFAKKVMASDSNITIIDLKSNTKTLSEYTSIRNLRYHPNMFAATKDGLIGVIDSNFDIIMPFEYNHIQPLQCGFFRVRLNSNNKEGLFNLHSGFMLECKYNEIYELAPNLFSVKDDSYKCALLNTKAELITEFKYALLHYYREKYILAFVPASSNRNPSKYLEEKCFCGLLNFSGEELIKPIYDGINLIDSGVVVEKNHKYGIYDSNFKKVSPIRYSNICYIDKHKPTGMNFARVSYNNHDGYIYW